MDFDQEGRESPLPIHRKRVGLAGFLGSALAFACEGALADATDDLINLFRESVKAEAASLGAGYAGLINFASEPDVSSSRLGIDSSLTSDDRLRVIKLPIRFEFAVPRRAWKPFVQATLAKLSFEQTADFSIPGEGLAATWESYSATLGGGVRIPIVSGLGLLLAIDGGYARLSNSATYSGQFSNTILKPAFEGIFLDWSKDAWLVNGHLSLQYQRQVRQLEVDAKLSYTLSHIESFESSSAFQEFSEKFATSTFRLGHVALVYSDVHLLSISKKLWPRNDILKSSSEEVAGVIWR